MQHEQIYNWLSAAFSSGSQGFTELFYYDKLNNEFFSVLLIDHFMFDENFNIRENTSVSYSSENIQILADRMRRIAHDDPSILSIPIADSEVLLQQQIDTFLISKMINIDTATLWLPEDSSLVISLDQQASADTPEKEITAPEIKPWWKFW